MTSLRTYMKCYDPRFLAWTLAGVAVAVAAAIAGKGFEPRTAPRLALAGVQAASMGAVILAVVLRMRHLDELQRRIQFESIAVAFGVSAAAISGWGYFEKAGLPRAAWSEWGWPLMVAVWGVAFLIVKKRYE